MKHNTIKKISQEEISRNQVEGNLPDKPSQAPLYGGRTLTPEEIKGFFDKLPKLIAERYNEIATAVHNGEFDGKSAYQYAVEYGYEGSEEEFGFILAEMKTYKEYTDQHLFDHDEAIHELQGANEQLYMIADDVLYKADNHEKRLTNLEKGLPADRFVTDDSVAYVKRIPTNACPFAALSKVGGVTKRSDNLIPFPYSTSSKTINGVTFTVQDNGSIIVNGTATANTRFDLMGYGALQFKAGEYHTLTGCPQGGSNNTYRLTFSGDPGGEDLQDIGNGYTKQCKTDANLYGFYIYIASGFTAKDLVFLPKLEVGASPTPYEKKYDGIRTSKVTAIESKDASGNIIGRIDIPTDVQSFDGYGEGAGTASNYIDFESAQFVKKVHTIDLGTLNWEVQSTNRFVAYLPTDKIAKPTGSYKTAANAVCSKYDNLPQDTLYANKVGVAIQATAGTTVYVYDTTYTDATTFKSAMSGVTLCYELADEYVDRLDISDLITADNLIEVEGGGTLTFVNEHGAAAASTIEYQVKGAS